MRIWIAVLGNALFDAATGDYKRCKKNERSPNKLGSHRTPLDRGPLSTSYQQQSVAASRAPGQVKKKDRQEKEAKKRHQKKKNKLKFKRARKHEREQDE